MTEHYQGDADEDKELISIEELSQRLEGLYKEMEQIRRENLLFESYLIRHSKDLPKEDEFDEKKGKGKGKKEKNVEKKVLSNEEKYDIANFECEALKKNIDDGRIKSDSILETLRAILEETDMAITEIRKDAFDFQREILIGGENSRTGKIEAERIIKYREEKLRQKDATIEKNKAKKATYESQIFKTESQIKKKEEMGDDLKFIDFHQLQIENKKYVKDIDQKNADLLDLKIATGKIVTKLTNEKQNLKNEIKHSIELEKEIDEKKRNLLKTVDDIEKVTKENIDEGKENRTLSAQFDKMHHTTAEGVPKVMNYVKQKKMEQDLEYEIKNFQRKIEIMSLTYEKIKSKKRPLMK